MNCKQKFASKSVKKIWRQPSSIHVAELSQAELLGCLRNTLFENKIDAKDVELFLNEFNEKAISGKVFIEIMQKNKKYEELPKQFSTDIQKKYGIWQVVEMTFYEKLKVDNQGTDCRELLPQLQIAVAANASSASTHTYSDYQTEDGNRMPIIQDISSTIADNDLELYAEHMTTTSTWTYDSPYNDVPVSSDNQLK